MRSRVIANHLKRLAIVMDRDGLKKSSHRVLAKIARHIADPKRAARFRIDRCNF